MTTERNLIVEFVVPHYFSTLLDWQEGLGVVVHWKEGDQVVGDLYRLDGRDDMIEIRSGEHDEEITRGWIENVERIVVL